VTFSSLYEILHPKYVNVFTYSNKVLPTAILLLIGICILNVIILDFSGNICIQTVLQFCVGYIMLAFCKPSSEPDKSTCSSPNISEFLIPLYLIPISVSFHFPYDTS